MYRNLAGDTRTKVIANTAFVETMPRVSPDGHWIAYVTGESGSPQVVVQPFPGPGSRTQVSVRGGTEPVWSHDGRRLFYRDTQHLIAANVSTTSSFSVTSRETLFTDMQRVRSYLDEAETARSLRGAPAEPETDPAADQLSLFAL